MSQEDFSKYVVKEYKYWNLQLHHNQGYLGRLVVWCKRDDAVDLTDATKEEWDELFTVIRDGRNIVEKVFKPDMFNYSFLSNKTRHLHGHIVPRYSKENEFEGETFKDELWGQNYRTDHDVKTSEKIKEKVFNKLKSSS